MLPFILMAKAKTYPRDLCWLESIPFLHFFNYAAEYSSTIESFGAFGRDPACTAAFSSFAATQPSSVTTFAQITHTTLANGQISEGTSLNVQTVPTGQDGHCRAFDGSQGPGCFVHAKRLNMVYFPPPDPNTACLANSTSNTSNESISIAPVVESIQLTGSAQRSYATSLDGYV